MTGLELGFGRDDSKSQPRAERDALCQVLFETREDWLSGTDFVLDYRKLAVVVLDAI